MMRTFLLAFAAGAVVLGQDAPVSPPRVVVPKPLWTVSTGLAAPESAYYHRRSNSIFVSNQNGGALTKDGNGYLTRIAPNGKVIAEKWATGLNAPKGIRSVGMTIWVADIEEVVGFEITADGARLVSRIRIDGAPFLYDLATAPDGTIFVTEPDLSRIYTIKEGTPSIFVEGADAGVTPNGLLVDGNRLIVGIRTPSGTRPGGQLVAFDLETKARTVLTTIDFAGEISGIEPAESGGYFVSDLLGRRLFHVAPDGHVTALATFDQGGADIGVNPMVVQFVQAGTVFLPLSSADAVAAYDLYPLIRAAR